MKRLRLMVLGLLLALLAWVPVVASAQDDAEARFAPDAEIRSAFDSAVRAASRSVVELEVDGEARVLGTIVDAEGYVLSKASELEGDAIKAVLPTGRAVDAEIVGVDRKNDLAMLKIDAPRLHAVEWSFKKPALGRMVACVATGRSPSAVGIISAKPREIKPAQLILGVILRAHPDGLWIDAVSEGFGAEKAGIKAGDVLTHIGTKKVIAVDQVVDQLQMKNDGDEVRVKLLRDGESVALTVGLSEFGPDPRSRSERMNRMGSTLSERRRGFQQVLQHDAEIRPEHCGGPLVNLQGEVVGINIARAGRIASYALPSDLIRKKLAALKSGLLKPESGDTAAEPVKSPMEK
ncbi:MAG: PDZ domain-containing protein [Phycisphaeraceae bacterium]